jgi:hypothetical protein
MKELYRGAGRRVWFGLFALKPFARQHRPVVQLASELVAGACGCEVGGTGVGAAHEVRLLNVDAAPLEVRERRRDFDAIRARDVWHEHRDAAARRLALPNPCMHSQRRIIAVRAPLALRKPLQQRPKMRPHARPQL